MHIKLHHSEHFTVEVDGKPAYNLDEKLVEIEYTDLVTLRNNSGLTPGVFYRITDYVTTVNSEISIARSAGHAFDIIVQAITADRLCEDAYATLHEDDEYFANSDLSSWRLKYSLDNDEDKYEWATPSGKGVIYYLKDEHNNECSYDFKNIQFYDGNNWCYTFTKESDGSDSSFSNAVTNNKVTYYDKKYRLAKVIFIDGCENNTIINSSNISGYSEISNCVIIKSGDVILKDANNNITIEGSSNVTIGKITFNSTIRNSRNVTIGGHCDFISIDESIIIEIDNYNSHITVGKYCEFIGTVENNSDIIIGECCTEVHFEKSYTKSIYVEPHVHGVVLTSSQTTTSSNKLRYIKLQSDMYGGGTISHNTVNDAYFTNYNHNAIQN